MRYEAAVTSISWIPSEAITGALRAPFDAGVFHYDAPPPDVVDDIEALGASGAFRFANILRAWVEVDPNGRITAHGYSGGGLMGSTVLRVGALAHDFQAVALPEIQRPADQQGDAVRFVQTNGGRTGVPAPRRVRRKPFIQWQAPLVWTTLGLTIRADGTSSAEIVGASRFPRHWIYDGNDTLTAKVGLTDFKDWYRRSFGRHTPWGDEESPALSTAVETALERTLSTTIMHGAKPKIRRFKAGATVVRQGDPGDELLLVLDGVIRVERDGERLAEYGPGAVLGERAVLEGGRRTSTLVAVTPTRVAAAAAGQIDRDQLTEVAQGHRREDVARA